MSEYQYYEFRTVDRPLTQGQQQALRRLSTRASITPSSFVNTYEWGDFKGDPARLMQDYFDLHLYLANWGTRRLALRLPKRLVEPKWLAALVVWNESVEYRVAGEHVIVDIERHEIEDHWEDEEGVLAQLAPVRADVLSGDWRLFYLIWLMGIETEEIADDASEPLPGLAPLSQAHRAFADFFAMDIDLLEAAAAAGPAPGVEKPSRSATEAAIRALSEDERVDFLLRLSEGEPLIAAELQARLRAGRNAPASPRLRKAGEIKQTARLITQEKQRAAAAREAAERKRQAAKEAEERRVRLEAVRRRGEYAWREVEDEIARGNAKSYERAASLLTDLRAIAEAAGSGQDFSGRLAAIQRQHGGKWRFIEQLKKHGLA